MIKSYQTLKKGGKLVSTISYPNDFEYQDYDINAFHSEVLINSQTLDTVRFLLEEKIIKAPNFTLIPFSEASDSILKLVNKDSKEKIVVKIEP